MKERNVLTLPGRWETSEAIVDALAEIVRFGLDENYWDTYAERVRALDVPSVAAAADEHVHPERLVWIVVGDWTRIEPDVRALKLGEIHLMSAEGEPLAQ